MEYIQVKEVEVPVTLQVVDTELQQALNTYWYGKPQIPLEIRSTQLPTALVEAHYNINRSLRFSVKVKYGVTSKGEVDIIEIKKDE